MIRWFLLFMAAVVAPQLLHAAEQPKPPNVIIFLADDAGYGEFGFQGNTEIPTPHIDSIAANGVRFTQAYVAATYCSPSRAGLMTGRYPTRFGHEFNMSAGGGTAGLPLEEKTIAERLKGLGYSTLCAGKWDLGSPMKSIPTSRGFDEFYGTCSNSPYFHPVGFIDSRASRRIMQIDDASFYTTDAYAARAVQWIGELQDRPFFLYLAFNAQHEPLQAPQKYLDRFPQMKNEHRKTFAAVMSAMDDAVGAVLAEVKKIGQEENTLIVFASDNGPEPGSTNGPLRGLKGMTLEGGVRVAHCMQWTKRISPGCVFDRPILNLDILPTVVVAAGGEIDADWNLDGVDLMPYLTGQNTGNPHETLYWRQGAQWAIRKGEWKLGMNRNDRNRTPSLYNLKDDIAESRDLAAALPEKARELRSDWAKWNAEQATPLWEDSPVPSKPDSDRKLVP